MRSIFLGDLKDEAGASVGSEGVDLTGSLMGAGVAMALDRRISTGCRAPASFKGMRPILCFPWISRKEICTL